MTGAAGSWARVAGLPLRVDAYALDGLEARVSSDFVRRTTVVRLQGGGHEGVGEDVTYEASDHGPFQDAGPVHPLAGEHTLATLSDLLGTLDLFPAGAPAAPVWRSYRRWAFESAALDLALRQSGLSLGGALGREPRPVTFVVSTRIGDPPDAGRLRAFLERYPGTRFKLDPTPGWTEAVVAEIAALGAVDTLDLKGAYKGTSVDNPGDARLYRLVAEGFPEAWIEDPDLDGPGTRDALAGAEDRITWDVPIHGVEDIEALPFPPRTLNFKPSRFGSLRALLDAYDHCAERGIAVYGGGQFELGPGRGQIQALASHFHPDTPNDVAPSGYNDPAVLPGLPTSPLPAAATAPGFRGA